MQKNARNAGETSRGGFRGLPPGISGVCRSAPGRRCSYDVESADLSRYSVGGGVKGISMPGGKNDGRICPAAYVSGSSDSSRSFA